MINLCRNFFQKCTFHK